MAISREVHKVNNVDEAVELATSFMNNCVCDLFRGQLKDFPLKSAFVRLDKNEQDEVKNRYADFESWFKQTKGLEELAKESDHILAVAQHYGFPTNFVDFTTSPHIAGFFASSGKIDEKDITSCILCLNSGSLLQYWKDVYSYLPPDKYSPPEVLHLQVPYLSRIKAQKGVFLYCPYPNFEKLYPDMKVICFPYSYQVSYPKIDQIYPDPNSLEILLYQYFKREKLIEGGKFIRDNTSFKPLSPPMSSGRCDLRRLLNGKSPPELNSWNESSICNWLILNNEKYDSDQATDISEYTINLNKDPISVHNGVLDLLAKKFTKDKNIRKHSLNFSTKVIGAKMENLITNKIERNLKKLWNGIRGLPYEDEDVIHSLANYIILSYIELKQGKDCEEITSNIFGKTLEIEFGSDDLSYSRSFASQSNLLAAVRDDIHRFLDPNWETKLNGNIVQLLQTIRSPRILFDYKKLARVFVREIIPVQILREKDVVFFSPARLDSFGVL